MKTNKILVMGMLMAMTGMAFTACNKNDDEKTAEIVDDPIKATTEYYINGTAVDASGKALEGVTVKAQDGTSATTEADGTFVMTVKATGNYTLSATKDSYLNANSAVSIASNATNRTSVNTSFIMTSKASALTIGDASKNVVISTATNTQVEHLDEVLTGMAVEIPANTENLKGASLSITSYIPEATAGNSEAAVGNLYIDTQSNIGASNVKLAVANSASEGTATFEKLTVYKSSSSRSGDNYEKIGDATLSNNKFVITMNNGDMKGDYSFRASYSSSASNGKDTKSGEEDNSGSLKAIKNYKITYEEKTGWEYVEESGTDGVDENVMSMIYDAVKSSNGAEGVVTKTKTQTTNISGNSILYYTVDNNYTINTYTFKLTGNKTVTVKTKSYKSTNLKYQIVSADQHSGGSASGM